jgi:OPT family oligopeptide transporter
MAWKQIGLWYGAPLMVSYGLVTFLLQGGVVVRALRGMLDGAKGANDEDAARSKSVEVPTSWFVVGGSISAVATVVLAWGYFGIPPVYGVLAVVLSFFLSLVSARATGETSVTPMGPLGKMTQLAYGALMPQNAVANLVTAGITAGSSGSCADLLNDLKVGYLLGANPRRQYVAQLFGVAVGTVATTLGYFLLVPDATVLTGAAGVEPRFPAPGAQQWKAVADVFRLGLENLHPLARQGIWVGVAVGAAFALFEALRPAWKKWLPSPTGLGFGLMLPFSTPLSFFLGALAAEIATRLNRASAERYIVPIASGVIAGESILGVVVAALNTFVL